ncbi:MAG TPA: acyloxyacyl hydrolase [Nitrospirota bacterium]|nr:acyloxyacyl hydrolase [Nitrospirota bacterium]
MTLKGIFNLLLGFAARKHVFAFFCLLIFAHAAMAQDSAYTSKKSADMPENPGKSLDLGTSQLGFWAGYSSTNPTLIGHAINRSLFEFNVQYARVLRTGDTWALKYTAEIVPVAIVRQPPQGFAMNGDPVDLPGGRQRIYGAGISPLGLQMNFRRGSVLQPYVNGTAGVLYFSKNVPVADSSNFNFTFSFGAGVEIWYREDQSIILGYKYHHISNGYTASQNPGVDSNLFYAGFLWSWSK